MYTQEELEKAGLLDFRVFLCVVWEFLGLPKPTKVQLDIAHYLQHGKRRKIIMAFRGVGKSWITVAFVLWKLLLDPQKKIMVVSASQTLADDFSKFTKQLIMGMPLLQHLAPRPDQRNSAISFDVGPATPSKDPSVKSVGITGQLTGSRADLIVPDDVEVPKNSLSHLLRARLGEAVKEFDAVLKKDGEVVYLGTPQTESSLYRILADERGYDIRVWPAEMPKSASVYRDRLAPFIQKRMDAGWSEGTPTDKERFNADDLMSRRVSYGPAGYALQFMLDTSPADAKKHPLKLRDLVLYDCDKDMAHVNLVWGTSKPLQDLASGGMQGDFYHAPVFASPEMAKYSATVMAIDPSGMGSDETAYAIVKYLHGLLYVMDVGGFRDGYGESTLKALAGKALRWGVNDIIIEPNYGGGMFDQLLKPYLISVGLDQQKRDGLDTRPPAGRIDDEWKWARGQKEIRICDTLEPIMLNHKLVVNRRVIEDDLEQHEDPQYSLVHQLTRISRVKGALGHDDRIEVVSMAASYFTEKMNRDQNKAVATHKEAALVKELKKFMQSAMGVSANGRSGNDRWRQ